jgi:hypothetical protein
MYQKLCQHKKEMMNMVVDAGTVSATAQAAAVAIEAHATLIASIITMIGLVFHHMTRPK